MKQRFIYILIFAAVIAGVYYFLLRKPQTPEIGTEGNTPEITDEMQSSFGVLIDANADRTELKDVTGGTASAIATRVYEGGRFSHAVLADLPDPANGEFYEGWLVRGKSGDNNFDFISTGKMRVAKGGYILEFESNTDYTDHPGVVITLEKTFDNVPETHLLEGSF